MSLVIPMAAIIFFFFSILPPSTELKPDSYIKTTRRPTSPDLQHERLSHLHFYFHDIVSGKNATAVPITKPVVSNNNSASSFSAFGMITMMDDMLTAGPEAESERVGRAQGMYACAALEELGFLQAMNLYFTAGKYNGSVLTVLGRNAPMDPVREMAVIGGSGLFRFARGFALARTHWIDFGTGDAVVEYNVTVLHY